jgi:LuxR family maltose regulon positive regulatory protein
MLGPMFLHARARVALHWGDRVGIAHLLRDDRENPPVRQQHRSGFVQRLLLADEIDLTMSLGAGSRAQTLLDDADKSSLLVVRRGWLALRSGHPQEAFAAAAAALSGGQGNSEEDISALLLSASASRELREPAAARRSSRLAIHRIVASGCRAPLELLTSAELDELRAETEDLEESRVLDDLDEAQEIYPEKIVVIQLSERERAILTHLAAGRTFADIAQADFVTLNTLKTQARSLYRKLEASDRDSALRKAYDAGLL